MLNTKIDKKWSTYYRKVLGGQGPSKVPIVFCTVFQHTLLTRAMAPHSSTLACRVPWTEEPGRLQSMGSLRVGHN